MGSIFVHSSVGLLGLLIKGLDPVVLLVAANFPDIEYLPLAIFGLIKTRSIKNSVDILATTGVLHSIIGNIVVSLPILYFGFISLGYNPVLVLNSAILGLASHLILDIPAHPSLMMLWPFKVYNKNPLLLKWATPRLEKIYPYRRFEKAAYQYMAEFQWTLLSMVIPLALVILIFVLT
ncbi:MAG: metal-dependent hydrolase [archaeon]